MAKYVTEFVGAFFLFLTVGLTAVQDVALAPLAVGSILMAMVYMGYHVSGGHYNPAVTVSLSAAGKLERKYVGPYLLAQIAGTLLAALAVRVLAGEFFVPAPGPGVPVATALLAEVLFAFALVIVVLNVAADPRSQGNSYFGLAIGFVVMVAGFAVGGVSGGVLNPSVAAGPMLARLVVTGSGDALGSMWLYWVGPVGGGLLAVAAYRLQARLPGDEARP